MVMSWDGWLGGTASEDAKPTAAALKEMPQGSHPVYLWRRGDRFRLSIARRWRRAVHPHHRRTSLRWQLLPPSSGRYLPKCGGE